MFVDGEVVYDDALLYGYRSHRYEGEVSPLWRVISCPLFSVGYEAHEIEGQPTITISHICKPQLVNKSVADMYGFFVVNIL